DPSKRYDRGQARGPAGMLFLSRESPRKIENPGAGATKPLPPVDADIRSRAPTRRPPRCAVPHTPAPRTTPPEGHDRFDPCSITVRRSRSAVAFLTESLPPRSTPRSPCRETRLLLARPRLVTHARCQARCK